MNTEKAMEARARRAARKVGLVAQEARWRQFSCDKLGGFMVMDPATRMPVAGDRWHLSAQEVIQFCQTFPV
jgi:hypothetical protein